MGYHTRITGQLILSLPLTEEHMKKFQILTGKIKSDHDQKSDDQNNNMNLHTYKIP